MLRIARVIAVGFLHHIIQRGNNRQKIFFFQKNRRKYLDLFREYAREWDVAILAYCLMTNHIHFLVRPNKTESQGINQPDCSLVLGQPPKVLETMDLATM